VTILSLFDSIHVKVLLTHELFGKHLNGKKTSMPGSGLSAQKLIFAADFSPITVASCNLTRVTRDQLEFI